VKHQLVKVEFGAADSATQVSSANPLPTVQTGALPAGANAIGKLAANSGVDIGDVDVTSSALPTGASTAAKQPALGTAGAASADVISVQGVASMTPVKVDGSAVTQPVSGTVTANLGTAAVTNAGTFPVQADTELTTKDLDTGAGTDTQAVVGLVVAKSGGAANVSGSDPLPVVVSGTVLVANAGTFAVQPTANATVDVNKIAGTATDTNSGTKSAGTQRVVLATDQPQLTNALKVDGSAVTQPVSGTVSITANSAVNNAQVSGTAVSVNSGTKDAGTQRVILASDQTVVPISDNSGSLTVDAPVGTPLFVTTTPSTTGGWSQSAFAALTNTKTLIKGSAGTYGGYYTVYNPNSSVAYVQIFDAASTGAVTLGTTVANGRITVPATSAANLEITNGVNMANGIVIACTTTATGSTAPTTGLDGTILYK
jgi:hypothetical protein